MGPTRLLLRCLVCHVTALLADARVLEGLALIHLQIFAAESFWRPAVIGHLEAVVTKPATHNRSKSRRDVAVIGHLDAVVTKPATHNRSKSRRDVQIAPSIDVDLPNPLVDGLKDIKSKAEAFGNINNFPADHLTAFGSSFQPDGKRPHLMIGVGMPKSGSTYIYDVLKHHNDTIHGVTKELRYFSGDSACTNGSRAAEYGNLAGVEKDPADMYIDSCFEGQSWTPGKVMLDFSPGYLTLPGKKLIAALEGLKDLNEHADVRFLAVLRDPVQRAQSAWTMRRDVGDLKGLSKSKLTSYLDHAITNGDFSVASGEYYDHLSKFLEYFPKEQVLIVSQKQLAELSTWQRIIQHIGLKTPPKEEILAMMASALSNSAIERDGPEARTDAHQKYVTLDADLRKRLQAHYADHNANLWKLLGTTPWW